MQLYYNFIGLEFILTGANVYLYIYYIQIVFPYIFVPVYMYYQSLGNDTFQNISLLLLVLLFIVFLLLFFSYYYEYCCIYYFLLYLCFESSSYIFRSSTNLNIFSATFSNFRHFFNLYRKHFFRLLSFQIQFFFRLIPFTFFYFVNIF